MTSDGRFTGPDSDDVAVIGMACLFPGAPDLASYWQNIVGKVDAVTEPPADWGASEFYDPDTEENDRTYCKRGGYLGSLARFDPARYGVMPLSVDGSEPDHFLALRVACDALEDAGYVDHTDGRRVEVVLGRGTYVNRGYTNLVQHGMIVDQTLRILKQLHPEHTDDEMGEIKRRLKASLPPFNAEVAPGLVPNIVSGRIANRLDLMGANFIIDAACASSLIAVDRGMQDLNSGRCDLAVVGGVHASTPALIHMIFSQLGALSRTGNIRPFDKDADGTLLGEGVGIVVLKRTHDAERDGDRIYCTVKGVGTASDGRALGLLAPRVEGEALALHLAYEQSGVDPETVGLLEAHGTGTAVGDATEISALSSVFGPRRDDLPTIALGSVKSMISHLLPAAGIAGLIKTALALHHRTLPPTLHCEEPDPAFGLERTPFYLNTEARPWIHGGHAPRRAGVNAFGFGGINAHAVLEEHGDGLQSRSLVGTWDSELCLIEADSVEELVGVGEAVASWLAEQTDGDLLDVAATLAARHRESRVRLAIVAESIDDLRHKLDHSLGRLRANPSQRIRDRSGIFLANAPVALEGRVAVLFPGEGSQFPNMLADLCMHFPSARAPFDLLDRAFYEHERRPLPSQVIFPHPLGGRSESDDRLWQMDHGAEAVFAANHALWNVLTDLAFEPDGALGHSTGEYSASPASGALALRDDELINVILDLHSAFRQIAEQGLVPGASLVAVGGVDRAVIDEAIGSSPDDVVVAMDNCPHQVVVCGSPDGVERVGVRLRAAGAVCSPLPFGRAYHTPMFRPAAARLSSVYDRLPFVEPTIELYSCATARRYPSDLAAIRKTASGQWDATVRFGAAVERMYDDGYRVFVEAGAKGILTSFVHDILRDRPHLAVSVGSSLRSGTRQLNETVAQLVANHVPLHLDALWASRSPRMLDLDARPTPVDGRSSEIQLSMGLQPLSIEPSELTVHTPRRLDPSPVTEGRVHDAVETDRGEQPRRLDVVPVADAGDAAPAMRAYFDTMERFLSVQESVMRAHLDASAGRSEDRSSVGLRSPEGFDVQIASTPPVVDGLDQGSDDGRTSPSFHHGSSVAEEGEASADGEVDVATTLRALVAERTGYPMELIDLDVDLEGELGIDSIKRVEILASFHQQTGLVGPDDMDHLITLKSLRDVVDHLASTRSEPASITDRRADWPASVDLPFLDEIIVHVPGREVVVRRTTALDRDTFLLDHTLGGRVSEVDRSLTALPVMPLTMTMEMLAEVASLLAPGRVVVRMENVRAHTWISFDRGPQLLELAALVRDGNEDATGLVTVDAWVRSPESDGVAAKNFAEASVVMAWEYPPAPTASPSIDDAQSVAASPRQLYGNGMFHGPSFQGVARVDTVDDDSIAATLVGLPTDGLFAGGSDPTFLTDPVLLDAAGQLIGFWAAERLDTGFNIFPYRVAAVDLYAPPVHAGVRVSARAQVTRDGSRGLLSDIELRDVDGRLIARLEGWADQRFELPVGLSRLRVDARAPMTVLRPDASKALDAESTLLFGCLDDVPCELLEKHGGIWRNVLAHLVLGASERAEWNRLDGSERDRTEWLLAAVAAKDVVRGLVKTWTGEEAYPADVVLDRDLCRASLASSTGERPLDVVVSAAAASDTAIALAADAGAWAGVGVWVEGNGRDVESSVDIVAMKAARAAVSSAGRREPAARDRADLLTTVGAELEGIETWTEHRVAAVIGAAAQRGEGRQ